MFSFSFVLLIISGYFVMLYLLARWAERGSKLATGVSNSSATYSLSLAVYCTTWTFYGAVEFATKNGIQFLAVYLGPTLVFVFARPLLRRLIHLKNRYSISNIADLAAARFSKSGKLSALVTIGLMIGIIPYLALQLKMIDKTTMLIVDQQQYGDIQNWNGPIVLCLIGFLTIFYGLKGLDQSQRHRGLVVSLAFGQIVKLVAFLAVGFYVVYSMFNGIGDLAERALRMPSLQTTSTGGMGPSSVSSWLAMMVVSASAILFLPRQFHLMVVENSNIDHLKSAMWKLPAYLFLINIFVLPIAVAGMSKGLPLSSSDNYVISLPLLGQVGWLAMLVYLGGFSAAVGMIMMETMTISTMVGNNLVLPVIDRWDREAGFNVHLIKIRWAVAVTLLLLSYAYYRLAGNAHTLFDMGLISFVGVFQLAPSLLMGIFSRFGNKKSAMAAMSVGFLFWFYSLFLPVFAEAGNFSSDWISNGPFGISLLRPHAFLGLSGLDPVTHTFVWTLILNLSTYVLVTAMTEPSLEEYQNTLEFIEVGKGLDGISDYEAPEFQFPAKEKFEATHELLSRYLPVEEVKRVMDSLPLIKDAKILSVRDFATLKRIVEAHLAGAIGAAAASKAVEAHLISDEDREKLKIIFSDMISRSSISPEELFQRIDFQQEKQKFLEAQALNLTEKLRERDLENEKKTKELEKIYQQLVQSSKMSALGEMASGIAHEINNPLTVIAFKSSQLQTLVEKQEDKSTIVTGLKKVEETAYRIAKIIRGLQSFSRNSEGEPFESASLQTILSDVFSLCAEKFRKNSVTLVVKPFDDFLVFCRPTQISQVILNLLNNAFDAVVVNDDKWIEVEVLREKGELQISVTDSGLGISPQIEEKIMHPFFTTKEVGKGTGLGLSISKGIIEDHGGHLFYNRESPHTQFVIRMPIAKAVVKRS